MFKGGGGVCREHTVFRDRWIAGRNRVYDFWQSVGDWSFVY